MYGSGLAFVRRYVAVAVMLVAACSSKNNVTVDDTPPPGDDQGDDGGVETGTPDAKPPKDTGPPPEVKVTAESLSVNGTTRTYTLVVPLNYSATKQYPLVMYFHGDGEDGAFLHDNFPFEEASHSDAILAYPDGANQTWDLYGVVGQNKDFDFINALVDDLAKKFSIDKQRVLGTGYSNGAFFINELACHFGGLFKAIAPHAGGAPDEEFDPKAKKDSSGFWICPGGSIPAIVFHGTADRGVAPSSGDFDAQYWAHVNGCQDTRSATTPTPCLKHDGCPTGKQVEWCLITGLGHTVWDQGNATAWAFFNSL
jgi:polyhydroxybutyrate depolymerase